MEYRTDHGFTYSDWEPITLTGGAQEVIDMIQAAEASGYTVTFHDPDTGIRFGYRTVMTTPYWINEPAPDGTPGVARYATGLEYWNRVRRIVTESIATNA
jgi:hypothetical protein